VTVWGFWVHYNELTTWSRVLPEKLTGPQLLEKFPTFYGTRRFITAFTRARHLAFSSVRFRRFREWFLTCLSFYDEELLAPRPTPKLVYHPLSAVRDCLFIVFATTHLIWRPFLHSHFEDAPCNGDRGPLNTVWAEYLDLKERKWLEEFHKCHYSLLLLLLLLLLLWWPK
jgi:hypothetical protein